MSFETRYQVVLLSALLAAAGCAQGTEIGGDGEGGTGGEAVEPATPPGCSVNAPCAPGKICHNGACAKGCNGDVDCDAGEFCSFSAGQICQPVEAPTCPETACTDTQVCLEGLCGTQTGQPCAINPFTLNDGCPPDQLCLDQIRVDGTYVEAKQCYTVPPCGPDNTCAVGSQGATCSFGLVEEKHPLCIPGGCLSSLDCPADFACLRRSTTDAYGHCSDGSAGSVCMTTADCQAGTCLIEQAGFFGTCQGGA